MKSIAACSVAFHLDPGVAKESMDRFGYQVVEKSFDEKGQIFILRMKNQELLVTLTKDLVKSLHDKKDYTYGFADLENEMVNVCRVVNKSYVENGPSFVLNLDGQVEPVTVSKDLVKYSQTWL